LNINDIFKTIDSVLITLVCGQSLNGFGRTAESTICWLWGNVWHYPHKSCESRVSN